MMLRIVASLIAAVLLCAQTPMLPGFPPGTFQNRAALDTGSASSTTTWNPADKNAQINLTNGDLTATEGNAAASDRAVRANNTGHSSGKYYVKYTITQQNGLIWAGIGTGGGSLSAAVGFDTNSIGHAVNGSSGNVVLNSAIQGADTDGYATGDVMCVALDLTANTIYFQKNGGNWNSNPIANPATNVGGLSVTSPQTLAAGPYFPMVSLNTLNDAITADFSAGSSCAVSGFSAW